MDRPKGRSFRAKLTKVSSPPGSPERIRAALEKDLANLKLSYDREIKARDSHALNANNLLPQITAKQAELDSLVS